MKLLFFTVFFLLFLVMSCSEKNSRLTVTYKLQRELNEVSGIAYVDNKTYVIEDSGNNNSIYLLKQNGKIDKELIIENVKNKDWEDLTSDNFGNLYIGDFGNNDNMRKNLCIYKIYANQLGENKITTVVKTSFYYPEQKKFPSDKKEMFYDCESFFEWKGSFYLFTKNRSKDFDGTVLIYKVPNKTGRHKAELIDVFKTCSNKETCTITSASITNDGTKMVLLSHSIVWLFENFESDNFTNGKISTYDLQHKSQKEAICFKNNDLLIIADEAGENLGNVYEFPITVLKIEP
ncbi:hypothetical protein [uncultured Flavobacterium sp.]|uniref:hypothetical protein n=1 Tax=uncultured Flavobacterium sp. TaxID=165435 RepID=UPI0030CA42A6|tara:strand:- start:200 stop:1072 length:873 start_codon:yes stop_codon:yes gene_type:complete